MLWVASIETKVSAQNLPSMAEGPEVVLGLSAPTVDVTDVEAWVLGDLGPQGRS